MWRFLAMVALAMLFLGGPARADTLMPGQTVYGVGWGGAPEYWASSPTVAAEMMIDDGRLDGGTLQLLGCDATTCVFNASGSGDYPDGGNAITVQVGTTTDDWSVNQGDWSGLHPYVPASGCASGMVSYGNCYAMSSAGTSDLAAFDASPWAATAGTAAGLPPAVAAWADGSNLSSGPDDSFTSGSSGPGSSGDGSGSQPGSSGGFIVCAGSCAGNKPVGSAGHLLVNFANLGQSVNFGNAGAAVLYAAAALVILLVAVTGTRQVHGVVSGKGGKKDCGGKNGASSRQVGTREL